MQPASNSDGSGSTKAQGGMSRAEASRARLAAQRERLAQQRARLSASGAKASSIQRSDSGASVKSTLSSILDQAPQQERPPHVPGLPVSPRPAAAVSSQPQDSSSQAVRRQALEPLPRPAVPSERLSGSSDDDRRPGALQGRGSGASDGSRGSGLLSPGGPRSRSAAIDVPTSPSRIRRSPRYTPYEDDPYLPVMGAPLVADPVPAVPGQGKAAREQPELSPAPEVINTGFASIDSKQKASQLFSIPARLSKDADKEEDTQPADKPAAEAPRRKKKEEGSLPSRLKPPAGKQQQPGQLAAVSRLPPRPEALPQAPAPLNTHPDPPMSTLQEAAPLGSAHAPLREPSVPQQQLADALQLPGSQPALSIALAPSGDDAAAVAGAVDLPAPSLAAQTASEAPSVKPYFPAFGSLIPPVPEDSFWQSAPATSNAETEGSIETSKAEQGMQLPLPLASDGPFSSPIDDAADTVFWSSAGQHAKSAMQQPELSSLHPEEQFKHSRDEGNAQQQQQQPPPLQQSSVPDLPNSNAPVDTLHTPPVESASMTDPSFQRSSSYTTQQPGPLTGPSTIHAPSSSQHGKPEPASSSTVEFSNHEDSAAPLLGPQEQQAPIFAENSFGPEDAPYDFAVDQFSSPFPSGQDDDASFFEELGAPGHTEPVAEPHQAASRETNDAPAPPPDVATGAQSWQAETEHITQGQQEAQQMQAQIQTAEGQQQNPEWNMHQHGQNSAEQHAPVQAGIPFGQPQAHWGDFGQAPLSHGPFDTPAVPEHSWETQPAGVLSAPAWPSQAPAEAPRQDAYASGGQNYYGAGAQASASEASKPASKSSSGWGKLSLWGGSQPAEEPAQPPPDEGVLYYGASEAYAAPPPAPPAYASQQPSQNPYGGFQPPPFMPAAQPQQGAIPFGPPPAQASTVAANAPPFARPGVQPFPPAYAQPPAPAAHAVQPVHVPPQPAHFSGSSVPPPVVNQQTPWQPSAQQSTFGQQPPLQQHMPPWLQSGLGNNAQSSYAQPQPAGSEQAWQSSRPLDSAVQHPQEAAGVAPWQDHSSSAFSQADDAQHAEAAQGGAWDSASGPGMPSSMSSNAQADSQQPASSDDQAQAFSHREMMPPDPTWLGAQPEQPGGAVLDAGPFGAADASEADFWGQDDAEVDLAGPFASTTVQQGGLDSIDKPEQGVSSVAAAWENGAPEQEQRLQLGIADSTAEAPASRPDTIPLPSLHNEAVGASQEPPPIAEAPAAPAVEQQTVPQGSAPDSAAAGPPGTAQPDTGPAVTPFGSEAAQNWQTAGSAALPLPDQLPANVFSAPPEGHQDWVASQNWSQADGSMAPEEAQVHHGVPEHHPADQPQAFQEHQAWMQPQDTNQPEAQAGGAYASHGIHEGGTAEAAQHSNEWHTGQYDAAGQHPVPSWQGYQAPSAFEHSSQALPYQDPGMAWQGSQAAGSGSQDGSYAQHQSAAQHSVQQQPSQAYMPPAAVSASGPLFKGGQNAWTAQQRRVPSDADAGLIPKSAAEAMRVTHGRPPCPLVAFGIGGRVAVLKPALAHGSDGKPAYANVVSLDSKWLPGQLSITRMGSLAAYLGPSKSNGQVGAVDDTDFLMQRFPGPLTPAVPKEKVLAFLEERAAACEHSQSSTASLEKALWGVLRILAGNAGFLRAKVAKGKHDEPLEAELAAVLAPAAESLMPAWPAHASSMPPFQGNGNGHAAPHPGAADALQKLLLAGRKAEALRTAVECGLWGPALILARAAGDGAYAETVAAMAAATAGPGSPLSSLLLMLAGGHELVLPAKPSARGSPAKAASGSSFNLKGLLKKSSSKADVADVDPLEVPQPSAAETAMLADWRSNLAALASCMASPADEALIVRLGDRLWEQQGQVEAAHLCYLVGGVLPQVYDVGARMCLLGADHRALPHTLASLSALQRTEVLEWTKLPGMAQPAQLALPLLPYKLLYAYKLAEYGHLAQALQYLGLVRASVGSLGNKMPAALLVCNGMAAELEQRLRAHAAAFNVSVKTSQSSSFMGGLGRLLDKGINRLISGDLPPSGPPSTGSDADPFSRQLSRPADPGSPTHRRSSSLQSNGGIAPVASFKDLASASQQAFAQGGTPAHQSKPGGSPTQQAPGRQAPAAQQGPSAPGADPAASGPPSSGPSSIRSMFSGLGGLLGASLVPPKKEAKLGAEENTFFYDQERKIWRERGAEIPVAAAPLPPPPTMRLPSSSAPSTGPPPPAGQMRPGTLHQPEGRGASSRYVNTLTSSNSNRTSSTMLPPLVPPPPSGSAAKPPSFFVPPTAAQRPAPISSPAQELSSQPFDTGAPAQILAEQSAVRDAPQAALENSSLAPENGTGHPADYSRPAEGRRSSGFGQWLNNGSRPTDNQAGAPMTEAPAGPARQPGAWQGSQLYGQAAQQQPWNFQPPQRASEQEPASGDIFTAYASLVKPAQQTSAPSPGQGIGAQQLGLTGVLGPSFPTRANTPALDGEEMKEIEL